MSDDHRRMGPRERLRHLTLALQRHVAEGAASGMVHGVVGELRRELPELDERVRALVQEALSEVGQVLEEAVRSQEPFVKQLAQDVSAAASRGMLQELEREWQDGGLPLHDFVLRLNALMDEAAAYARSRADVLRGPEELAASLVRGAARQGREEWSAFSFEKAGRELARGFTDELRQATPALEAVAEKAAAATVRGAHQELAQRQPVSFRAAARDITLGVMDAIGILKRPLLTAVTTVGAFAAWAMLRQRRA